MSDPRKQSGETLTLIVSEREFATILAGLRCFKPKQHNGITGGVEEYFHRFDPLSEIECDELAERLNFE